MITLTVKQLKEYFSEQEYTFYIMPSIGSVQIDPKNGDIYHDKSYTNQQEETKPIGKLRIYPCILNLMDKICMLGKINNLDLSIINDVRYALDDDAHTKNDLIDYLQWYKHFENGTGFTERESTYVFVSQYQKEYSELLWKYKDKLAPKFDYRTALCSDDLFKSLSEWVYVNSTRCLVETYINLLFM